MGPSRALAATLALAGLVSCGARTGLVEPADDAGIVALDALDDDAGVDVLDDDAVDVVRPPDAPVSRCGNGVVEPGEQCDLGAANALVPAFAVAQGAEEDPIAPIVRRVSAARFYDYRSASAHTGFESPGVSVLFLYCDAASADDELALFTIHGRDDTGLGAHQPPSRVTESFTGAPAGSLVAVSDDPGEFHATGGAFAGNWTFDDNTDGGAITDLAWATAWTITVDATFAQGVMRWQALAGPTRVRTLAMGAPTRIIHRVVPSACRPDCRVPRCGDGYIDAGERCDDGNTRSGDGCAGDCGSLE